LKQAGTDLDPVVMKLISFHLDFHKTVCWAWSWSSEFWRNNQNKV